MDGNSTYNLNLGKDNATVVFLNSFKEAFEEKIVDKQITLENKKYLELYFEYVFGKICTLIFSKKGFFICFNLKN